MGLVKFKSIKEADWFNKQSIFTITFNTFYWKRITDYIKYQFLWEMFGLRRQLIHKINTKYITNRQENLLKKRVSGLLK